MKKVLYPLHAGAIPAARGARYLKYITPFFFAGSLILSNVAHTQTALDEPLAVLPTAPAAATPCWKAAVSDVQDDLMPELEQERPGFQRHIEQYKLTHGSRSRKEVAITFDDGPHPASTARLLDILHEYNAKATFFVVGKMAERYPEMIQDEIAEGHNVGNHTYHHINLLKATDEQVADEIEGCNDVLKSITGETPHLFRPPGGDYNNRVAEDAAALGYHTILWTNDPGDYASPGEEVIADRLFSKIHNGSIILLHDGIEQTIDLLPSLLDYLEQNGYEAVTVDRMMADRAHDAETSARLARKIPTAREPVMALGPSRTHSNGGHSIFRGTASSGSKNGGKRIPLL